MIEIDGSYLEGGGQSLRTAIALAAVTKKPCRVFHIRKNRPKPGLATQHLLGIQALTQLSNGRLEGDELGSEEIKFYPGEINRGRTSVNIKIKTAGSITLFLQSLIPPALFAPKPVKITIDGGATDTFFSPTFDHFRYCFLKILEKTGGKVEINVLKRGYYPEGGAKIEATIYPSKFTPHQTGGGLKNLNLLERGELKRILVISGASEFLKPKKVAERQTAGIREVLGELKLPVEEKIEYYQTQCPGSQICLIAEFALRQGLRLSGSALSSPQGSAECPQGNPEQGRRIENTVIGADNLGKLGKRAEDVGKEAALELLKEQKSQACLDKYLADQILPYMALAKNKSSATVSEITNHCRTNIWVIEKFIEGKFKIRNNLISWIPKI